MLPGKSRGKGGNNRAADQEALRPELDRPLQLSMQTSELVKTELFGHSVSQKRSFLAGVGRGDQTKAGAPFTIDQQQ